MKITVKAALEMAQAIAQLDGYRNGGEQLTLYKYDGATRLAIAIARRKLRAIAEDYQTARNAALMEVTDGAGELPALSSTMPVEERRAVIARNLAFDKADKELQTAVIDIDIDPLPAARFQLEDNPIPPAVLDMLGEFIALEG